MIAPVVSMVVVALLLWLAVWSVVARDAFLAVAAFVAYGLLLALVWVRLAGMDVALTEAAIGGGLTGALLLGAVGRLRRTEATLSSEHASNGTRIAAALLALGVTVALMIAVTMLPEQPPTLAPLVVTALPATSVGNPITGVLLAFRALDTMLEAIVLVIALIGVWSFAPDHAWGGRPGHGTAQTPMAFWPIWHGSCRHWASSSASICSGPAPTIRVESSRVPRSWRRCGCWSRWRLWPIRLEPMAAAFAPALSWDRWCSSRSGCSGCGQRGPFWATPQDGPSR